MPNLTPPTEGSNNPAIALLVVSSVLWGSSFVAIKIGLTFVDAYDFAFLRLAVTAVVSAVRLAVSAVLLVVLVTRGSFRSNALKEPAVWLLGLLSGAGYLFQFLGLQYTTAAKSALLIDMNVIVVAILSWKIFGESFGSRKQLGVVLGVLGAVLITTNGDIFILAQGELKGDFLSFISGLIFALFILIHKRLQMQRDRNVIEMSSVVMLATAIVLFPTALFLGGLKIGNISAEGWAWVAFTAVVCTVMPYALWIFALKAVTATIASVVGMLEIVTAMVLSTVLLGESYATATLLGAILVLVSILAVAES
jgi:drug/metabolite transporter (DMT)-like permease